MHACYLGCPTACTADHLWLVSYQHLLIACPSCVGAIIASLGPCLAVCTFLSDLTVLRFATGFITSHAGRSTGLI